MTGQLLEVGSGFEVILADPPWKYARAAQPITGVGRRGGAAEVVYPTMTNDEIADLPVRLVAADDAHLFMWVTNPKMFSSQFSRVTPMDIVKAWGFEYKTLLTWVKTTKAGDVSKAGMGWYFRGATEHVIYATRGKARIPSELREPNVLLAPATGHSRKPEAFMDLVERVTPGMKRLEMFSRSPRLGWSSWGNEIEEAMR